MIPFITSDWFFPLLTIFIGLLLLIVCLAFLRRELSAGRYISRARKAIARIRAMDWLDLTLRQRRIAYVPERDGEDRI